MGTFLPPLPRESSLKDYVENLQNRFNLERKNARTEVRAAEKELRAVIASVEKQIQALKPEDIPQRKTELEGFKGALTDIANATIKAGESYLHRLAMRLRLSTYSDRRNRKLLRQPASSHSTLLVSPSY
jgi:hypothetical protein